MREVLERYRHWILGGVLVALTGFVLYQTGLRDQFVTFAKHDFRNWLNGHPVLAPVLYMVVYVVGVLAFMPGSVMTLVGGAVFGFLWGFVYTSVASTVAAGGAFLIARYFASDWVERRAGKRMEKLQVGIEQEGWKFIVITRMIPFFPYNLLNYMFGLTRIHYWTYLVLTWACMIPGTVAYVYAGHAVGVTFSNETPAVLNQYILLSSAVGVVLLVSLLPRWFGRLSDEVENERDETSEMD